MATPFMLDIKLQLLPQTQTLFHRLFYAVIYWVKYNIYFCKAVFFLLGLVFSHHFVENTMESLLMGYLTDVGKSIPEAAAIVNMQEGLSFICALIIAHLADAYVGRFRVVFCGTASYIFGLMLWCLTNLQAPNINVPYILIMVLLVVGKASKNPPLKAFLRDQLVEHKTDDCQADARVKVWWFLASRLGAIASVMISIFYPKLMIFMIISASVMGVCHFIFWSGIAFYYCENPTGSPLTIVYRVLKASLLKLHLQYANDPNDYYDDNNSDQLVPLPDFRILRWLDKAALLESSPRLEEQLQGGRLCSVRDVKRVKQLFTLIPMWTTLLGYGLVLAMGSTLFVQQADNLENVMPIGSFFLIQDLVTYTAPYLYNRSIAKWWHKPIQQAMLVRIGVGMAFSILCCLSAWLSELHRLDIMEKHEEDIPLPMSILWLAPQYICLGVMEGLVDDMLSMFYHQHTDESMKLYESPFNDCVLGVGKVLSALLVFMFRGCWFNDTINTSHLDGYFLFLAYLSSLNLCFYGYVAYKYACSEARPDPDKNCMGLELGPITDSSSKVIPDKNCVDLELGPIIDSSSKVIQQSLSFPRSRAATSRVVPLRTPTFT